MTTERLLRTDSLAARAEMHWRLAAPLATLGLGLLALPLARSPPRAARHGKLLIAVLSYLLYLNFLVLGRAWLGEAAIPIEIGLWWVHLPVFVLAWWLLRSANRMPPGRRRAAAQA